MSRKGVLSPPCDLAPNTMNQLPSDLLRQALLDLAIDVPIQRAELHAGLLTLTLYGGEVRTWHYNSSDPDTPNPKKTRRKHVPAPAPGSEPHC